MSRFSEGKYYYLVLSLIIVFVFIFAHLLGILKPVESVFIRVFSPIQSFFYRQGENLSNAWLLAVSFKKLSRENVDLQIKNQSLENEVSRLKEIENENQLFREQLGFSQNNPFATIPSLVVGSDPSVSLQFINIDKGEKEGVKVNKPALTSSGIMIGKVFEVNNHSAKVLLLTDPNSSIIGITQDSRANGLVKGEHGLGLKMTTIAQDKEVQKNEKVVTAGMEPEMPKGLLIGEIEEIIARDNELFKEAKVKPLANFKKIEMVFVVK